MRPENHLLHKKMAQTGKILSLLLSLSRYDLMLAQITKKQKIPALHHTQQTALSHTHIHKKQKIFIYIPFHPSPKTTNLTMPLEHAVMYQAFREITNFIRDNGDDWEEFCTAATPVDREESCQTSAVIVQKSIAPQESQSTRTPCP